jgi:hypothetical protein
MMIEYEQRETTHLIHYDAIVRNRSMRNDEKRSEEKKYAATFE